MMILYHSVSVPFDPKIYEQSQRITSAVTIFTVERNAIDMALQLFKKSKKYSFLFL